MEVPAGYSRRLERRLRQNARDYSGRWSTWSAWLVPAAALVLIAGGLRIANSLTVRQAMQSPMAQLGKNIPPEMQVIVTDHAKVFHVVGCPFIHNKDKVRTLTAAEAMREGYVPCLRCMRKYLETVSAGRVVADGDGEIDADAGADDNEGGQ
jgi:hypothetical protein